MVSCKQTCWASETGWPALPAAATACVRLSLLYGAFFLDHGAIFLSFLVAIGRGSLWQAALLSTLPQYDLANVVLQRVMLPLGYSFIQNGAVMPGLAAAALAARAAPVNGHAVAAIPAV